MFFLTGKEGLSLSAATVSHGHVALLLSPFLSLSAILYLSFSFLYRLTGVGFFVKLDVWAVLEACHLRIDGVVGVDSLGWPTRH